MQCALTVSFLEADRAYAPQPADQAIRDRFVLEQSRLAALLDPRVDLATLPREPEALVGFLDDAPLLADGWLPRDEEALLARLATFGDALRVGPQGRAAVSFLRSPPLPQPAATAYGILLMGAVATLPRNAQGRLGLHTIGPRFVATVRTRALLTAMRMASGSSPVRRLAKRRATLRAAA